MERIARVFGFARVDEAMRQAMPKLGWVLAQRWYYHQQLSVADENEFRADHIVLLCRVGIPSRRRLARQWRIQDFMKRRGCFAYVLARAAKLAHAHYHQASRARSARSWPVPNPPRVVGKYVRACLLDSACCIPTNLQG